MTAKRQRVDVCRMCETDECRDANQSQSKDLELTESSKNVVGTLSRLPNEVIGIVVRNLSIKELSVLTLTNKWLRNFIYIYFFETKKGLKALLGHQLQASEAMVTPDKQRKRIKTFRQLGLLLKRMTCLLPTADRLEILVYVLKNLDDIPLPSLTASDNHTMRFIFQCYGRLIHRFVAGWDDSELKHVFKALQKNTQIDHFVDEIIKDPVGAHQHYEYYVRSFYRMLCLDPASDGSHKNWSDSCFWLRRILKKHSVENRAKLVIIIYGPLISTSPTQLATPYIGWWDLTDTFFVENGLVELGLAFFVMYGDSNSDQQRSGLLTLVEKIMRTPERWLMENVAALLYRSGDELTFDYLNCKLKNGKYTEVAQHLVFLSVVAFKLEKETKAAYKMIERLATDAHKVSLYNEMPIAFSEAITEAENSIELEDERDVSEVHDIVDAESDLLKLYMIRATPDSSQSSVSEVGAVKCNEESSADDVNQDSEE